MGSPVAEPTTAHAIPSLPRDHQDSDHHSTSEEEPSRRLRVEFGVAASLAREQGRLLFNQSYGYWPAEPCDPCGTESCLEKLSAEVNAVPPTSEWAQRALDDQIDQNFEVWKRRGGLTIDHLVTMNSCAYKTRTRWNPHGVWLHISGRNVTTLRFMADGYRRAGHIKQYITEVVNRSPTPFDVPLSVYVSVTDIPCNVQMPYLTFFTQRGVFGIVIPDNSFVRSVHGGSWDKTREKLLPLADSMPFESRQAKIFFRGSPTHKTRENLRVNLTREAPEFADIKLAVMEKFKQFTVKLEDHAKYRFLLAIRGKTASSRDKYLTLLGSVLVWASETEPWFQFYHTLWRPYVNYIPMTEENAVCICRMLNQSENLPKLKEIARRATDLGRFLNQSVADAYMLNVLRKYAALQTFRVDPDPIAFLKNFRSIVKRRYKTALVMPDDQSPVKFVFEKWLNRRIKQMTSCRTNNTFNGVELPAGSRHRCWYM